VTVDRQKLAEERRALDRRQRQERLALRARHAGGAAQLMSARTPPPPARPLASGPIRTAAPANLPVLSDHQLADMISRDQGISYGAAQLVVEQLRAQRGGKK
jgi:hypothetical protein